MDVVTVTFGAYVHAVSHVTGGGLAADLARVLPPSGSSPFSTAHWRPAPIFDLVLELGAEPQSRRTGRCPNGEGNVAGP
jgi:phosphoribosylformylglycinamidine cyclo-ligase